MQLLESVQLVLGVEPLLSLLSLPVRKDGHSSPVLLACLQLGEIPHTSALIPAVMQAFEGRMLELLQEAVDLSVEAHIDAWTECWIFETIG